MAKAKTNPVDTSIENVVSVYSGRPHHCCCGCSGKHYNSSKFAKDYDRAGRTISDKMVRKAYRLVHAAPNVEHRLSYPYPNPFSSAIVGNRLYVVYYNTKKSRKAA